MRINKLEPNLFNKIAEIMELARKRQEARKAKDFAAADALRDELKSKGYVIEDTPAGMKVKKI